MTYNYLLEKLFSYYDLEDDWDGYGGKPPSLTTIGTIVSFVMKLQELDAIPPNPMLAGSGEVGLYWDIDNIHIEVVSTEVGLISYAVIFHKTESHYVCGEEDIYAFEIPNNLKKYIGAK